VRVKRFIDSAGVFVRLAKPVEDRFRSDSEERDA